MNTDDASRPKATFFRFSLRGMLFLLAVVGILLALLTPRLQRIYQARRTQAATQRMIAALKKGDLDAVERAVAAGADLRVSDPRGITPLGYALQTDNMPLFVLLLRGGAQPGQRFGRDGISPLEFCLERGSLEMMALLLEMGTDTDFARHQHGPPLHAAIESKRPAEVRLPMIRLLLENGADMHRKIGGCDAMGIAVRCSDVEGGALLREFDAPYTPREMVAFNQIDDVKQALAEQPEIVHKRYPPVYACRPGQEPTLLGFALERGYRDMSLLLIESGAPIDTIENLGATLLHKAARGGNSELVRLLVAKGLDVEARDVYGDTPLGDVAGRDAEVVKTLLDLGAEPNVRGMNQRTPLHGAIYGGCPETVRILLEAGADPTIPGRDNLTAIDVARAQAPDMLSLLEKATANSAAIGKP